MFHTSLRRGYLWAAMACKFLQTSFTRSKAVRQSHERPDVRPGRQAPPRQGHRRPREGRTREHLLRRDRRQEQRPPTGDALEVVEQDTRLLPGNPLTRFLDELHRLANTASPDTCRLGGYIEAWKQRAAEDSEFRKAQDEVSDERYYQPSLETSRATGLATALAQAVSDVTDRTAAL